MAEITSLGSNGFDEETRDAYFEDDRTAIGKAAEIRECIMFGLLREVQKSWRPGLGPGMETGDGLVRLSALRWGLH